MKDLGASSSCSLDSSCAGLDSLEASDSDSDVDDFCASLSSSLWETFLLLGGFILEICLLEYRDSSLTSFQFVSKPFELPDNLLLLLLSQLLDIETKKNSGVPVNFFSYRSH